MKEYAISLDCGKFAVKSMGRNVIGTQDDIKRIRFRTKLYDLSNGYMDLESNEQNPSYLVKFNGKEYIIGEQGAATDDVYSNDKDTFLHQICAYTAITQFLDQNSKDNKVNIILDSPLSTLKVAEAKEDYKKRIKGDGPIKISVNNKNYEFTIGDITLKAEGSGILYLDEHLFKAKEVALIDFGGLNMGFSLYNNKVCKPENRFSIVHGANTLVKFVAEDVESKCHKGKKAVSIVQAEKYLEVGHLTKNNSVVKDSAEVIEDSKKRFFSNALSELKKREYELEDIESLIFVGGTAKKIENAITTVYPHAIVKDDWATAEGLYKVAIAKYIKKIGNKNVEKAANNNG